MSLLVLTSAVLDHLFVELASSAEKVWERKSKESEFEFQEWLTLYLKLKTLGQQWIS